jgi:hypothetical protein
MIFFHLCFTISKAQEHQLEIYYSRTEKVRISPPLRATLTGTKERWKSSRFSNPCRPWPKNVLSLWLVVQ